MVMVEKQPLHIIAFYANPFRWRTRRELFSDFVHHMRTTPGIELHVVEVAYHNESFEVTGSDANDVQLRSDSVLWHKENGINVAVQRLPLGWKYAGYVDGDFHFTRHDWAEEAIHQLQHYKWVQLYSAYSHLSPAHQPLRVQPSYSYVYRNYLMPPVGGGSFEVPPNGDGGRSSGASKASVRGPAVQSKSFVQQPLASQVTAPAVKYRNIEAPGATGGAWAWTRDTFNAVGGLLDTCPLGSADWHMAFGLTGDRSNIHPEVTKCGTEYTGAIRRWQQRAYEVVSGSIGYVENYAAHHWHGSPQSRGYGTRWHIILDHKFDPTTDLVRDWQGLWAWAGNKPHMVDDVTSYFISRNEDSTESSERPLI
jgi:hypothetical protein